MTSEEYDKLKEDECQVKIAELCDWTGICSHAVGDRRVWYGFHHIHHPATEHDYVTLLPNYPCDLNAMHEAESKLANIQKVDYVNHLSEICKVSVLDDVTSTVLATAAQRCRAFVLTMTEEAE